MISFDEFQKTELRVGKITAAERVPDSEKLIKLEVDLGEDPSTSLGQGKRQIIAGIGKSYSPEELLNKNIVVVVNLEPRKLMGLESQGMLLAAHDADGNLVMLTVEKEVPKGSKIT